MIINEKYRVLGLMSGTSLDGIDLAICTYIKKKKWEFIIEKSKTVKYTNYWKNTLANLHKKSEEIISSTNIEYGKLLAHTINNFLSNEKVDFIASHGHTIIHQPENKLTLQIGDGQTISNITKIKTINNFRNLDISLDGQGAPLVPIGDLFLFKNYKYCINLGGFANISIKNKNKITAFDICPTNIIMNEISSKIGYEFDKNGRIAEKGNLIPKLLKELNSLSYYQIPPPKSLSREWLEKFIHPLILKEYSPKDLLKTFCEHIAIQIGKFLTDKSVLISGGGVFNKYLISRILYHSKSEVIIPNKIIVNFKEALIFGFMGVLRLRNEVNCLKTATGSKRDNCGGEINNPM